MANHKIIITENGTKTLTTAGKYCDRNIEVSTNVPEGLKPTAYTNVLDLDTTFVKEGYRAVTDNYSATSDGVAIALFLKKGTHDIRVRGKWIWWFLSVQISAAISNLRTNVYFSTTNPTDEAHGGSLLFTHTIATVNTSASLTEGSQFSIDEYGDWYVTTTVPQDGYLIFTLKDMSKVFSGGGSFNCDPIITVDEPIGYVEVTQ